MIYEIIKVDYSKQKSTFEEAKKSPTFFTEILHTGKSKDKVKKIVSENNLVNDSESKIQIAVIGYPDISYTKTGILEALAEFIGTCNILDYCVDPGYGYDHVMMYQLKFEDGAYGICIYDTQTKEFIEEPDEYDEYGLTPEEVERKYNFKHI